MLWFWVVVLVVLIGAVAIVASGRGDSMAEVYDDRPDASLPAGRPLNADDLRSVRLNTGVRGYRMDEVDALLARLEAEMLEREDHADVRVVEPPSEPLGEPLSGTPDEMPDGTLHETTAELSDEVPDDEMDETPDEAADETVETSAELTDETPDADTSDDGTAEEHRTP